ncbi:unnamed protein product [Bursaphelenchus xylophilus]|uniref:(pine wood nematode) hypothetical protein n=1 Tax=Bursaphelenchus xylophilus TaxID=6326 RepID=A0A1I7SF50_BURXY|nr:unnamed protein product [Bursaphelenchus xylophilus]CAG9078794.1 unnamed protein product [Bursaphelenchus xylophilus]
MDVDNSTTNSTASTELFTTSYGTESTKPPALSKEQKVLGLWISIACIGLFYLVLVALAAISLFYRVRYQNETLSEIFCGKKAPKEVVTACSTKTAQQMDDVPCVRVPAFPMSDSQTNEVKTVDCRTAETMARPDLQVEKTQSPSKEEPKREESRMDMRVDLKQDPKHKDESIMI